MKRQVLKSLQAIVGGQNSWYKHYTFSELIVFGKGAGWFFQRAKSAGI